MKLLSMCLSKRLKLHAIDSYLKLNLAETNFGGLLVYLVVSKLNGKVMPFNVVHIFHILADLYCARALKQVFKFFWVPDTNRKMKPGKGRVQCF